MFEVHHYAWIKGVSTWKCCLNLSFHKSFILEAGGNKLAGNMRLRKSKDIYLLMVTTKCIGNHGKLIMRGTVSWSVKAGHLRPYSFLGDRSLLRGSWVSTGVPGPQRPGMADVNPILLCQWELLLLSRLQPCCHSASCGWLVHACGSLRATGDLACRADPSLCTQLVSKNVCQVGCRIYSGGCPMASLFFISWQAHFCRRYNFCMFTQGIVYHTVKHFMRTVPFIIFRIWFIARKMRYLKHTNTTKWW